MAFREIALAEQRSGKAVGKGIHEEIRTQSLHDCGTAT
jgi:hypothetical protein